MSIWANIVKRFTAPSLPKPTAEYELSYMDNLVNILRLYFNQLDNLIGLIVDASPVNVNLYGSALDAFGRARVSQAYTLFDSQNRYTKNGYFSESTASGGTVTYDANASTVLLNVTSTTNSETVRQTYRSFSYQPGKGLLVMNTFVMAPGATNLRQRVGYFNTENGVFLELDGTTLYFVMRTYTSGAPVDTVLRSLHGTQTSLMAPATPGLPLTLPRARFSGKTLSGWGWGLSGADSSLTARRSSAISSTMQT